MNQKTFKNSFNNRLTRFLSKFHQLTFSIKIEPLNFSEKKPVKNFRLGRLMVAQSLNLQLPKNRAVLRIRFVPTGVKFRFLVPAYHNAKILSETKVAGGKEVISKFSWGAIETYELG
jgi:hypothetical protein